MDKVFNILTNKKESISNIAVSNEYQIFRSNISLKQIIVDDDSSKIWKIYDSGPRNVSSPLICLPPVSGTADIFFRQMLCLNDKGYRVIAAEYPTYWSLNEFIYGFIKLLDYLHLDSVHLFGASLGGFLAQKFAESTIQSQRVQSLFLCNSFADTSIFNHTESAMMFWLMPFQVLKKLIMGSKAMQTESNDELIKDSCEFMTERLGSLSQSELASRLTLNCVDSYVEPQKIQSIAITIMDVFDYCALSQHVCEEMYKLYPNARRAHLKNGGNFPYLSRSDEVNMHLLIHLRQFKHTKHSGCIDEIEIGTLATSEPIIQEQTQIQINSFED